MNIHRVKIITLIYQLIILINFTQGKKWENIKANPLISFDFKKEYKRNQGENNLKYLLVMKKIKLEQYIFKCKIENDNFNAIILEKPKKNKIYIYCWLSSPLKNSKELFTITNKTMKLNSQVIDMYQKINKLITDETVILVGYHQGFYPLQLLMCMLNRKKITGINYGAEIQNKDMLSIINNMNNIIYLQIAIKNDKSVNTKNFCNRPLYFTNHSLKLHFPKNHFKIKFYKKPSINRYLFQLVTFYLILDTSFEG